MSSPLYICLLSWTPLRASASSTAEMVSCLLFGETCSLIQEHGEWLEVVTTTDNYTGFIPNYYLSEYSNTYDSFNNILPFQTTAISADNSQKINLSPGSLVPESGVILLNGTEFHIPQETRKTEPEHVLHQFLHAPYLWGGRSIFGLDCSGLSQNFYGILGTFLPRDAYQQAELGETISFEEKQWGDLAFFANLSGKITHVGIITHQNTIIHASGMVRKDILAPEGILHFATHKLTHTLSHIKRLP